MHWRHHPQSDVSEQVMHRRSYTVGRFRCGPESPLWDRLNTIGREPILVIAGSAVEITHIGGRPLVANPTRAMLYNAHHPYHRGLIDPRGDDCTYFSLGSATLQEIIREQDPSVDERPDAPFNRPAAPVSTANHLRVQLAARHLATAPTPDDLLVHELLLSVTRDLIRDAWDARPAPSPRHQALADAAESLLSARYREQLSLADIAAALDTSPYHLARVFRAATGSSLHSYRDQLRLRAALISLAEAERALTDLALDLGYSSHAHLTRNFKRTFGVPPSALFGQLTARRVRELQEVLEERARS